MRITGPWFQVSYETPETAEPGPLTVVDEAASVGIARVRRLSWRGGKIIVSTTIHGYEGSGRAFERILPRLLPKPIGECRLNEPVRYFQGDPLEEWVYETFMLKAEPQRLPGPVSTEKVRHEILDPAMLVDREVLESVFGVLAQAHYRNSPDELLVILDSPHHSTHILRHEGVIVAVADVVEESGKVEEAARIGLEKLKLMAGPYWENLSSFRVSRIAVHPELQGRGLGSKLLAAIEEWARSRGADVVTTIFSRHDVIGFWLRNGYIPYYVSPRYNRVTGEKNIAMAKPLSRKGERVVGEASKTLTLRLLLAAPSVYRDLAAEKMASLLRSTSRASFRAELLPSQRMALEKYLRGELDLEQVMDVVLIETIRVIAGERPIPLEDTELVAVIARVVQGKPLNEVASIIGESMEEAMRIVDRALKRLLRSNH